MVAVALLLATKNAPPRRLEVVELPGVPDMGDALEHGGRGWNTNPASTMKMKSAKVAIFLNQLSGPPHLVSTASPLQ